VFVAVKNAVQDSRRWSRAARAVVTVPGGDEIVTRS
jgi:hypothetical protein